MRIKIKVPEAYLLLFPFDAKRPGLLVLDADGRRVTCIDLPGFGSGGDIDAPMVAELLGDAQTEDAVEEFIVAVEGDAIAFRDAVEEWDEVEDTALRSKQVRVAITKGAAKPARFDELAKKQKVKLRWISPVPLRAPVKDVPGVWYSGRAVPTLLDPNALPEGLEAKTYSLPGVPKGGGGAAVAMAPLKVPGVVTVFPDIFGEQQTVVARKGEVKWSQVRKAFRTAGVAAKAR